MQRLILDIDGVVANFIQAMLDNADEHGDEGERPCCWKLHAFYDQGFLPGMWDRVKMDPAFWMGIKPLPGVRRALLTNGIFPDMYLTARPIASAITKEWLGRNLLPMADVVTVPRSTDKLPYLREGDVFVDDLPSTVRAAKEIGVTALLMDAPFHKGESEESLEGLTTIKSLSEVSQFMTRRGARA